MLNEYGLMLNERRWVLNEQGRMLDERGRMLNERGRMLRGFRLEWESVFCGGRMNFLVILVGYVMIHHFYLQKQCEIVSGTYKNDVKL